jgi:hypothetical protein
VAWLADNCECGARLGSSVAFSRVCQQDSKRTRFSCSRRGCVAPDIAAWLFVDNMTCLPACWVFLAIRAAARELGSLLGDLLRRRMRFAAVVAAGRYRMASGRATGGETSEKR